MARASFPKSARLRRPAEFRIALRSKKIARGSFFTLSRTPVNTTDECLTVPVRLGLIIAKRFAKKATTRNALKRVAREAFRVRWHILRPGDYLLRLSAPIKADTLTQIKKAARQEIDSLFDKC